MIEVVYQSINKFIEDNLQDIIDGVKQFCLGILTLIIGMLPLSLQIVIRSTTGLGVTQPEAEKKEENSDNKQGQTTNTQSSSEQSKNEEEGSVMSTMMSYYNDYFGGSSKPAAKAENTTSSNS